MLLKPQNTITQLRYLHTFFTLTKLFYVKNIFYLNYLRDGRFYENFNDLLQHYACVNNLLMKLDPLIFLQYG